MVTGNDGASLCGLVEVKTIGFAWCLPGFDEQEPP